MLTKKPTWYYPIYLGGSWQNGYDPQNLAELSIRSTGVSSMNFASGLNSLSDNLTQGLNAISSDVTTMLNSTSEIFVSHPAPSTPTTNSDTHLGSSSGGNFGGGGSFGGYCGGGSSSGGSSGEGHASGH